MVSFINNGQRNIYFGLSTDSYPVDAPNGSALHEMDTTAEYLYDAENNDWIKQRDGGGGGGGLPAIESGDAGKVLTVNADEDAAVWAAPGGGGTSWLVANATYDSDTDVITLDKTAGEIWSAYPLVSVVSDISSGDDEQDSLAYWIIERSLSASGYMFSFYGDAGLTVYAASADDYPTTENPGGGGEDT